MKTILIDERMRKCEKEGLQKMGYQLVEIPKSTETYAEISSHVDIFVCKINNTFFSPKSIYDAILGKIEPFKRQVSDL